MIIKKVETMDDRKEFVQEVIDRLLYLDGSDRDKLIDAINKTLTQYKPKIRIFDDGKTRIYKHV